MTPDFFTTRSRFFFLALNHVKRSAISRILKSPVYRWRYSHRVPQQFVLIPQDLRTADPSFGTEVYHGHFGLAGTVAITEHHSPFEIVPPNKMWEWELHGFGWLRHFTAAPSLKATQQVKSLLEEWIHFSKRNHKAAYQPEIVARRIISWISHVGHFVDEEDTSFHEMVMRNLSIQIQFLSQYYSQIPDGSARLTALIALVLSGLCLSEQDDILEDNLETLCSELERQIFEDGGHLSRNPWVPVELALDLLPLKQCFISLNRDPPDEILQALKRILAMITFMRLGDGCLSRFNGMAATLPDTLATVLPYDDLADTQKNYAEQSGYFNMSLGSSKVVMDCGDPPELVFSSQAHAGCLSFEMSSGIHPIVVNCGAPGPANQNWRLTSRTTPSHSTLSIRKKSSSKILQNRFLDRYLDGSLLYGPNVLSRDYKTETHRIRVSASHNGYENTYGVAYRRQLTLQDQGTRLEGKDYLYPAPKETEQSSLRFPIAIHFHIHPDVNATLSKDRKSVKLELRNGEIWQFYSDGLKASLEESMFFADFRGPRRTVQIVLRSVCKGKAEFSWTLETVKQADTKRLGQDSGHQDLPSLTVSAQEPEDHTDNKQDHIESEEDFIFGSEEEDTIKDLKHHKEED